MPIIWIASYPKSGNTWVRAFLANLLADSAEPVPVNQLGQYVPGEHHRRWYDEANGAPVALDDQPTIAKLRVMAQAVLDASTDGMKLVKTHLALGYGYEAPTVNAALTTAAVYIIRNPLDVVPSYADHYGLTLDQAIDAMADPNAVIKGEASGVYQYLSSWSQHVSSWITAKGLPLLVLRYEDMHTNPIKAFRSLTKFIQHPADKPAIERAAAHASFKSLQSLEQTDGFSERSPHSQAFFRQGRTGAWREHLSDDQVQRVIATHGEVMRLHRYLDKAGQPV